MSLPALNAPPIRTRMTDDAGNITPAWAQWFDLLWRKTGEATTTAPISVSGSAASAATATTALNAAKASYVFTPSSPLAGQDLGAGFAQIVVATTTFTWDDLPASVVYPGVTLTLDDTGAGILNSTAYYVYRDDPNRNGAGSWKATTDYSKVAVDGRFHLRGVTTPAGGAPDTDGSAAGGVGKYTDMEVA